MLFKIFEMIPTTDFFTALECTKLFLPDPAGGAYSAPQIP